MVALKGGNRHFSSSSTGYDVGVRHEHEAGVGVAAFDAGDDVASLGSASEDFGLDSVFCEPVADVLAYWGFVACGHETGIDGRDAYECLFEGDYLFTLGVNLGE